MYWIGFYNNRDKKKVWEKSCKDFTEVCHVLANRKLFPRIVSIGDLGGMILADENDEFQDNEWVDGIYALTVEGSPSAKPHNNPVVKPIHERAEDAADELASDIIKARAAIGMPHPELEHLDFPQVRNEILSFMRLLFDAYTTTSNQTLWVKWYVDSVLKGCDTFAVAYYG